MSPGKISKIFKTLAGYRNRMVHFYHEITTRVMKITLLWLTIFSPKMFHGFVGFGSWAL